MAKEEKQEANQEKQKSESFKLSSLVLGEGYFGEIDGRFFMIGYDTTLKGERLTKRASVMESVDSGDGGKTWKATGQTELSDLTNEQIRILALAGVITLSAEQQKKYRNVIHP